MLRWDTYFRVIKQTPVHNAVYPYSKDDWRYYDKQEEINMNDTCLVIEMSTGIGDKRVDVNRKWELSTHTAVTHTETLLGGCLVKGN